MTKKNYVFLDKSEFKLLKMLTWFDKRQKLKYQQQNLPMCPRALQSNNECRFNLLFLLFICYFNP